MKRNLVALAVVLVSANPFAWDDGENGPGANVPRRIAPTCSPAVWRSKLAS